jgi:hypothetical protein
LDLVQRGVCGSDGDGAVIRERDHHCGNMVGRRNKLYDYDCGSAYHIHASHVGSIGRWDCVMDGAGDDGCDEL